MDSVVEFWLRLRSAWNCLNGRSWGDVSSYKYQVWCDATAWRCTRCDGRMNTAIGPRGIARYEHKCIPLSDKDRYVGRRHRALLERIRHPRRVG